MDSVNCRALFLLWFIVYLVCFLFCIFERSLQQIFKSCCCGHLFGTFVICDIIYCPVVRYSGLCFKLERPSVNSIACSECVSVCAGDVKYAEIGMEMGRPSGDAVVRFGSEEDALRAISILW